MNFFQGCTALITGASAGFGRELAWQLAPHAHALILVARRVERLEALKIDLGRAFPSLNVFIYGLDLADGPATDVFVDWLGENNLRVNFLVNNAGHGDYGPFAEGEWAKIESMIQVNITALTRLSHRLLPTLKSFEDSSILNVSSVAGFMPIPQLAVYAATKAYVTSFSEALRVELRNTGVSVTTVCPGPSGTEFGQVAKRSPDSERVTAPGFFKVPVEQVVREALRAVARDKARVIPGWQVGLGIALLSLVPMAIFRIALGCWNQTQQRESLEEAPLGGRLASCKEVKVMDCRL